MLASDVARFARCSTAFFALASSALAVGCAGQGSTEVDGSETSSALTTSEKTAYDFFVARGLKNYQSAGIIGNLIQESNVNPGSVQYGGPGRGIAQWSEGGRWNADGHDNAVWYASTKGESVDSLELQLEFVWYELTTFPGYGLASLKGLGRRDVGDRSVRGALRRLRRVRSE